MAIIGSINTWILILIKVHGDALFAVLTWSQKAKV